MTDSSARILMKLLDSNPKSFSKIDVQGISSVGHIMKNYNFDLPCSKKRVCGMYIFLDKECDKELEDFFDNEIHIMVACVVKAIHDELWEYPNGYDESDKINVSSGLQRLKSKLVMELRDRRLYNE